MTPIKVERLNHYLSISHYDSVKKEELIKGFTEGFDIGYRGPSERRHLSSNIPLHVGSPEDLWGKIMKEVKARRYSGPFNVPPYKSYIQSPIGLVPKAGGQTRLIFHLSFDFGKDEDSKSLNHHTPEELCSVKYRDLDYAVKMCLALLVGEDTQNSVNDEEKQDTSSSAIYFGKTDICSAFRNLPLLPNQRKYLLMKAKNPNTGKTVFFTANCLPFGASVSCKKFQNFFRLPEAHH